MPKMNEKWQQLTYFATEKPNVELFPEPHLHDEIDKTRQFFKEQWQEGKVEITDPFITAQVFVWQHVDYRLNRPSSYYDLARGYLMVEPEDIPEAACILHDVYTERKEQGKFGEFKWLMRKLPAAELDTDQWWRETHNDEKIGLYEELSDIHPRIVLYEHSPSDIQEILTSLTMSSDWQALESNRTAAFPDGLPPIRGTNRFLDNLGRPWHSLSYNARVGHSHEQ